MKKIAYIGLLTVTFTLGACSDEQMLDSAQFQEGNLMIQATMNNGQSVSRTHIYNTGTNFFWTPGDQIGVYGTTGKNIKFFSVETDNQKTARFSGSFPVTDTPVYAYYPYSEVDGEGLSGDGNKTWNVTLPETIEFVRQEYASVGDADRMGTNAPMIATSYSVENKTFAFKHVCGLMRITIASIPADAASLVVTSENQNISGKFTITDITTDSPALTPSDNGSKTVTVTLPETATYGEKTFYIPLPVAAYSKLTVELKKTDGAAILTKSVSNLSVACGQLVDMNKLTGLELTPSEVKNALANALVNGGTVDVLIKDVTSADATIEFPAFTENATRTVNLMFAKIPTSKLTINQAEGGSSYAVGTLNIKLPGSQTFDNTPWTETPTWTNVEDAPDFNINLPKTNCVLDAESNDIVAEYGHVEIACGTNGTSGSMKIGSALLGNVTVNSMLVNAGYNVNVYGLVGKIELSSSNTTTKTVSLLNGSNVTKGGYCYEFQNSTGRSVTYQNSLKWDGMLKCRPLKDASEQYLIRSAAELAYFQSVTTPTASTAANMIATMDANAQLCCDINLNNQPWLGMILGENATFDGGNHKVSNVKIKNYILEEESIYSKEACVGLFAATQPNSQIKDIEIYKFTASEETGLDAKWCGALVGYSRGTILYSNCKVSNVTIKSDASNAYRIGGLIGFIGKVSGTDLPVTLDGCSAENVSITGSYSLGGFIGTIQGSEARTIKNCSVIEPITIKQNDKSSAITGGFSYDTGKKKVTYYAPKEYVGNVGKFIGDLACSITFNNTAEPVTKFTEAELTKFGFNKIQVGNQTKENVEELTDDVKTEMKNAALNSATYVSLQDATTALIPAQTAQNITIIVDSKTLQQGNDFNKFTTFGMQE